MVDVTKDKHSRNPLKVGRPTKTVLLAGVSTRLVLEEAGLIVPQRVRITGDLRTKGVSLETDFLRLAPHVKVKERFGVLYLMSGSAVTGNVICECQDGQGGCDQ